jgi:hypothetical protein
MPLEQYANDVSTTLNGGISDTDLTLSVDDPAGFPTSGNFRIRVGSELIIVTGVAGSVFTVTRGAEGTTAAGHADNAAVDQVLTRGSLLGLDALFVRRDTFANRPAAGQEGRLFFPSDGLTLSRDTGSAWELMYPLYTGLGQFGSADWTWVNQGDATVTWTRGVLQLRGPVAGGAQNRMLARSVPGTPYTFTVAMWPYLGSGSNVCGWGLGLRDSSSGKLVQLLPVGSGGWEAQKWNSPTSFNALYTTSNLPANWANLGKPMFLRIKDDGTTRYFQVSHDGYEFHTGLSHARTDFITPDQVTIVGNMEGTAGQNDRLATYFAYQLG